MLLTVILVLLLIGNWLLSETLVFIPINLVTSLISFAWWGLALLIVFFLAWCIGED